MKEKDNFLGRMLLGNIGWQALAVLGRLLIYAGSLSILARIGGTQIMGLYGVAWVAVALGFAVAQSGAAQSIIVIENANQGHFAAGFVLAIGISIMLGAIMALSGPFVESFYSQPGINRAFLIGAVFVPFMSMGASDIAIAQKSLDFQSIARVQILSALISAIISIIIALFWDPLIGLFALQGLSGLIIFVLFRLFGKPWPSLHFKLTDLGEIWHVGMHLSFNSVTATLFLNSPQLIIARFLPLEAVGLFTLTRRIIMIIGIQFGGIVNQVIYPSFAKISKDKKKVAEAFLLTSHYTALGMMIPLIVLGVSPYDFLSVFAGPEWREGGIVLLIMVIMQVGLVLGQNIFPTFQAINLPNVVWKWNIILTLFQSFLIFIFGRYSIEGATAAMAASTIIMPFAALWLRRIIGFSFNDWVINMAKVILPAVLIGLFIHIIPFHYLLELHTVFRFAITSLTSVICYLGIILIINPKLRRWIFIRTFVPLMK